MLATCWLANGAPTTPASLDLEIDLDPPNPLVTEALEFLEDSPIKPAVEKLVQRKQILAAKLPPPEEIPAGSLRLEISDKKLVPEARYSARASWSMQVPKVVDGQFVYFLQLVHVAGQARTEEYRTWGVAKAEFNGNRYASELTRIAGGLGEHRIWGVLIAWSIKTEESFVLDVEEATFSVAAPGTGGGAGS